MTTTDTDDWGARALRLRFPGGVLALDDVSLAVPRGQVTAVVGGDGAGKTSLLRCLAGAIRPDSGVVRGPGPLRTGYLSAGSGLYPDLTVTENLQFRASAYGVAAAAARTRIAELTERAGLTAARHRLVGQLSGGMRQKLGVIAALLHEPGLLILDEPSTGVDPVSRSGLWSLIASAAAAGAAVVLATTYSDDAQRATWVLALDSGRQLAAGPPEEIAATMPGSLVCSAAPPTGGAAARAWRRGTTWRIWCPPDTAGPAGGAPVTADLQDAITVAALAREPDSASETASIPVPWGSRPAGPAVLERRPPGAEPLATTDGVTCRFGRLTAVRDVSIEVRPREIVGLIGANGAGKTTLIRMLLGLIPASSGRVTLLGEAPSRRTRRRIGYVPQGLGLYSDLTARQNMQFAAAVFGGGVPASWSAPGQPGISVGQLPLGLQRRVAFAQALAHEPDLLILDEPTSGVDPLGRARLWQTIAAAVQSGAGALVSTHYMEEAGECDRLIIMADGAVVATGTAAQIIGAAQTTVVEAPEWTAAFTVLDRAGLPVALSGRTLRLPGVSRAEAERVLADTAAGGRVHAAPATLEERFFELASAGAAGGADTSQRRVPA